MKRCLDICMAAAALLALSPLFAVLVILVRLRLGAPVFFAQRRPGKGGVLFTLWKFRTMTDARGPDGRLQKDGDRLTPLGRLLRATSLDELPEFWNILRGDMSLVGPRPLLPEYLDRYSPEQARRHEVRPGLTGWAQVNGRNAATWEDRLRMDVWYVDHRSLRLDLWILLKTVAIVLRREGISAHGSATMPEFRGSGEKPSTAPSEPH